MPRWCTHTSPGIPFISASSAQVRKETFSQTSVTNINNGTQFLRKTEHLHLNQPHLNLDKMKIKPYADSSFANSTDPSAQIGFIFLLCDSVKFHVRHYSRKNSQRVVRSVLGGEVSAFADAFENAFPIQWDLYFIKKLHVPIEALTQSPSLFDVITKCTVTTENPLVLDIHSVRNAFHAIEICNVGSARPESNQAHAFTNLTKCTILQIILTENICDLPVEQLVYCIEKESHEFTTEKGSHLVDRLESTVHFLFSSLYISCRSFIALETNTRLRSANEMHAMNSILSKLPRSDEND